MNPIVLTFVDHGPLEIPVGFRFKRDGVVVPDRQAMDEGFMVKADDAPMVRKVLSVFCAGTAEKMLPPNLPTG